MKNKKAGIVIAVILVIGLFIILYVLAKSKTSSGGTSGSPSGSSLSVFSSGSLSTFLQTPFQQILTGASTNVQSLFNGNVSNGDYNVQLPSYILNGTTLKSTGGSSAPTLDLQYMPKGCTIDSYIAGNC